MIPYGRQSINQSDIDAVVNVLKGDWLTTGPAVEKFEFDLQKFTGCSY
jgi:dTDP-4-amino-4,6-dideoxygalactose transaminase